MSGPLPKSGEMMSEERPCCPEEEDGGWVRSPGDHLGEAGEEGHLEEQGGGEEGGKEEEEEAEAEVDSRWRGRRGVTVSWGRDQTGVSEE